MSSVWTSYYMEHELACLLCYKAVIKISASSVYSAIPQFALMSQFKLSETKRKDFC